MGISGADLPRGPGMSTVISITNYIDFYIVVQAGLLEVEDRNSDGKLEKYVLCNVTHIQAQLLPQLINDANN